MFSAERASFKDHVSVAGKLAGMNENRGKVPVSQGDMKVICSKVTEVVNIARVPSTQDNIVRLVHVLCGYQLL